MLLKIDVLFSTDFEGIFWLDFDWAQIILEGKWASAKKTLYEQSYPYYIRGQRAKAYITIAKHHFLKLLFTSTMPQNYLSYEMYRRGGWEKIQPAKKRCKKSGKAM